MHCTASTETMISRVRTHASGKVLQRTGSASNIALWDSAATKWDLVVGTVLLDSRAVTNTTFSQRAKIGTLVWTASGLPEVTGAFVS